MDVGKSIAFAPAMAFTLPPVWGEKILRVSAQVIIAELANVAETL
jgi:hypothetical protein